MHQKDAFFGYASSISNAITKNQEPTTMKTKIAQTYDFLSSSHCPKCQGEFEQPSMRSLASGYELVYECKQCNSSFALVPVTTFKLGELTPDTWDTTNQESSAK